MALHLVTMSLAHILLLLMLRMCGLRTRNYFEVRLWSVFGVSLRLTLAHLDPGRTGGPRSGIYVRLIAVPPKASSLTETVSVYEVTVGPELPCLNSLWLCLILP